jgi:ribosomal protein L27
MATGRVPTTANSPLTAKGDLFGYSTTQARVAVGNDGETLVADSSTSVGLRYQSAYNGNAVINGGMDIWQRGTSFTGGLGNVYGADRWLFNVTSARTYSRQTASLDGFQYSLRIARNSGSTDTGTPIAVYSMESADSYRFAGKTVTLSFWAKAGANFSAASNAFAIQWFTGTGTDQNVYTAGYTGSTTVANTTRTITTSWARYSITVTFASNVTETGFFLFYTPTGTAGANDWVEVTGVQMELGSVPTEFKRASGGTIQGELAACQRYFNRFSSADNPYNNFSTGNVRQTGAGADSFFSFVFPVEMRIAPTAVTLANITSCRIQQGATDTTVTAGMFDAATRKNGILIAEATIASAGTGVLAANNSSAVTIDWSAEL